MRIFHIVRYSILMTALVILFSGCGTPVGPSGPHTRIDNVPMYGQPALPRPDFMKKADDAFIKKAASGFGGDRKAACVAWCDVGDDFMHKLNLDYAMRRFNQGWLLDPDSYRPFWGFGRVLLQQDKFDEAVVHFEKALALCNDPLQQVALLSDAGSAYSFIATYAPGLTESEKASVFAKANECFAKSTGMNPHYGNAWMRWAMSLTRESNFAEAWIKVKQAKAVGVTTFPPEFLDTLKKDMPEPK
jgi:hypothetical protein